MEGAYVPEGGVQRCLQNHIVCRLWPDGGSDNEVPNVQPSSLMVLSGTIPITTQQRG